MLIKTCLDINFIVKSKIRKLVIFSKILKKEKQKPSSFKAYTQTNRISQKKLKKNNISKKIALFRSLLLIIFDI